MRSFIFNKQFNTYPIIVHNPFLEINNDLWNNLCSIDNVNLKLPSNVSIVTWNNTDNLSLLEKQLIKSKINYINLSQNIFDWYSNRIKLETFISNVHKIPSDFVIGLDAFDVLITGNLFQIMEKFKKFNCEVLFNATCNNFPDYKPHECDPNNKQEFSYLNSGCFIGNKMYIKNIMQKALKEKQKKIFPYSDQFLIKFIFPKEYPKIQIDSECNIFQLMFAKKPIQDMVEMVKVKKIFL